MTGDKRWPYARSRSGITAFSTYLTKTTSHDMLTMNNVCRLLTVDCHFMRASSRPMWVLAVGPMLQRLLEKAANQETFMPAFDCLTCFPFDYFNYRREISSNLIKGRTSGVFYISSSKKVQYRTRHTEKPYVGRILEIKFSAVEMKNTDNRRFEKF